MKVTMERVRDILFDLIFADKKSVLSKDYLSTSAISNISPSFRNSLKIKKFKWLDDSILSISLAAIQNGNNIPLTATAGHIDLNNDDLKIKPETLFNLSSSSKFIIMNIILKLIEANLIDFDTIIAEHLIDVNIPNKRGITVAHLLSHHSGLIDQGFIEYIPSEPLSKLLKGEVHDAPGKNFRYSNVNFVILALLIESVTHLSLEENLRKYITIPLNLKHTYVINEATSASSIAHGYEIDTKGSINEASSKYVWGAKGFQSTPTDMTILMKNFFENPDYIPANLRDTVLESCKEVMFKYNVKGRIESWPAIIGYGIEKWVIEDKKLGKITLYSHGGWQNSNVAFLAYVPELKSSYCVLVTKTHGLEIYNLMLRNEAGSRIQDSDPILSESNIKIEEIENIARIEEIDSSPKLN